MDLYYTPINIVGTSVFGQRQLADNVDFKNTGDDRHIYSRIYTIDFVMKLILHSMDLLSLHQINDM